MINERIDINVPKDVQENWQQLADLIAQLCKVPVGLIMKLSGPDIEVLISSRGEENPYHAGYKEHFEDSGLYCETVIKSNKKLLVPDALADKKWKNNPDIKLSMISYLGFPIMLPNKTPFGTICVLDSKRNEFSLIIEQLMLKFKHIIENNLELLYMNQVLDDKNRRLTDYLMEIQAFRGIVPICSSCKAIRDQEGQWQPIEHYLIKHPEADFSHGMCHNCIKKLYPKFYKGS
ncbi:GAF domain-containing protein [Desulfonatronovibrio magnus]|uniref:GAF domain-containing protein n=1 Tax=Desulfonatronovibrio magnus TaxID=698827 RepID=UPI00069916CE|nr:GAF domain-containing protein [Desulfonatronovibrio magnus]